VHDDDDNDGQRVLISAADIRTRVEQLAARLSADYARVDELVLVGVLRGSFIFLADLARLLTPRRRIEFVQLRTYGGSSTAPGEVRLVLDLELPIAGRHVLVVEDIVDTGHTLDHLLNALAARRPASLRCCVLVTKPDRRRVKVKVDYLGFEIPDLWVVGYGLDFDDQLRALPYIAAVDPQRLRR
jgi:hypoxanthine phosphoribosyltransferase